MNRKKRVAVIGAGACGFGSMRSITEEGMEPVCFERTGHHGGLWRYHDEDIEGLASVMKTTILNHSKEMGSLSNKLYPAELPNYLRHSEVYKMLDTYMREENLIQYVRYNKEVVKVEFAKDYKETGRYDVTVKDTETGNIELDTFAAVFVCVGHHAHPNWVTFPGQETFKGRIIHSRSLKEGRSYSGKNVVVVGIGVSGADAAVEISNYANQVYLSTRRGAWIISRVSLKGSPTDLIFLRRWINIAQRIMPYNLFCSIAELIFQISFDHSMFSLKPKHRFLSQDLTICDSLSCKLLTGAVAVRENIERFTETGVVFQGDSKVTPADEVILATGYLTKFPFLGEEITSVKNNETHLYKFMYPPHLPHPTFAILGLVAPLGPGFPIGEAQCRLAAYAVSGRVKLPKREQMEVDIATRKELLRNRFISSSRHTISCDFIDYLEEINDLFGAKPDLWKIFCKDPKLWWALMFGPHLPYQYRLQGPHSWSGAREAILTYKERVLKPLQKSSRGRNLKKKIHTERSSFKIYIGVAMFVLFLYLFWFMFTLDQSFVSN